MYEILRKHILVRKRTKDAWFCNGIVILVINSEERETKPKWKIELFQVDFVIDGSTSSWKELVITILLYSRVESLVKDKQHLSYLRIQWVRKSEERISHAGEMPRLLVLFFPSQFEQLVFW